MRYEHINLIVACIAFSHAWRGFPSLRLSQSSSLVNSHLTSASRHPHPSPSASLHNKQNQP
jgi:hypothetical protein